MTSAIIIVRDHQGNTRRIYIPGDGHLKSLGEKLSEMDGSPVAYFSEIMSNLRKWNGARKADDIDGGDYEYEIIATKEGLLEMYIVKQVDGVRTPISLPEYFAKIKEALEAKRPTAR